MNSPSSLGIIFIAIAVVFLGISFRDYLKTEGKLTIARKIWIRMFIFAVEKYGHKVQYVVD